MKETTLPHTVEPDPQQCIWKERAATTFPLNDMHAFLEGSEEEAIHTLTLMQQIERDPILAVTPNYYELSKEEHRARTAAKIARLAQYMEQDAPNFQKFQDRLNLIAIVDPQLGTRIGVHLGLFLSAIKGNGTDEQFNYWAYERGAIYIKDIYGCFSMTEIAHGSNVAALQTTATYNLIDKTFLINTPHIGATKWWIGGAAHSATHTVVFARLLVKGKDYGVKTFVVPLRDKNHVLYPGISIGDIGSKMGRDGIDNGWIQFSNVKIPKEYMLSKFTKIDNNGNVDEPPLEQLSYGALLGGRVTMVTDSWRTGERFITIALRYSVGRRQFKINNSKFENQLINYPLHQKRLLPYLSWVYGMSIASHQIQNDYKKILSNLDDGIKSGDFSILSNAIDNLKSLFADSASLKSTCTWKTADLIDECRQSCGGHGYSSYSGFSKGFNDHVVQCTWEGDNNILAQNSGRITIQNVIKFQKNGKTNGNYSFLKSAKINGLIFSNSSDFQKLSKLNLSLQSVIYRISIKCIEKLKLNNNNWDLIANEKLILSKLYTAEYILNKWIIKIDKIENPQVKEQLQNLAILFALSNIDQFTTYFLQTSIFQTNLIDDLELNQLEIMSKIRNQVIGLTDSFKFSDYFINSVLGNFNGDIYNNYHDVVKNLNNDKLIAPYTNDLINLLNRSSIADREKNQRDANVLKKLA